MADAVTLNQDVQWERCARLAAAADRRALDNLREVTRAFYTRLLMRRRLLGAVAVAPAVALGWLVASRSEREVGVVIADPLAQSLAAATGIMLLVVAGRERILIRLDAWICPETTDQRPALAAATAALAQTGRITTISRIVTRTVHRGCGTPATLLVATDAAGTDAQDFAAPDARIAPLARASAIVHMLERTRASLLLQANDGTSVFALLPRDEAAWVVETAAVAMVPVLGSGAQVIGVLVVGRRFDDRMVRSADIPFLEVLAAAVGLAIDRLRLLQAPASPTVGCAGGARVPRVSMCDGGRRAARVRLRIGVRRDGHSEDSGGQVSTDAAPGDRGDGGRLSGARRQARARRRGQDPARDVSAGPDGTEAGGAGDGDGDACLGRSDLRYRVLAGPRLPRRRVAGRRHARGSATARAGSGAAGGFHHRRRRRRAARGFGGGRIDGVAFAIRLSGFRFPNVL